MTKSHLPKSVRKYIVKEKTRLKRDNLTQEDYKKKVDELYETLKKKPKEEKEKQEKKPIGKTAKKPSASKEKSGIKPKTPAKKIDKKQNAIKKTR